MALPEALIESYFVSARPLSIGLARRGVELSTASGYRRHKVTNGGWSRANGSALGRGTFGPFSTAVSFDEALLFDGDTLIERVMVGGLVSLTPGSSWSQELLVAVASA